MTLYFPSDQIQVYRERRIGSAHRYSMSATGTVWPADIQPASPQRAEMVQGGGHFGAAFTAFVDVDCDVKEGDQLHVGTKVYSVKGVDIWRGAGLLDHKELLLTSEDG